MRCGMSFVFLAITAAIGSCLCVSRVAASPAPDCNQPTPEPIVWVNLPGAHAFQALPSQDGCWVFVSLAPEEVAASDSDPAAAIAVFARKAGRVSLSRVVRVGGNPSGMALTHDGTILVVADGNRVGFFDIVRLISGSDIRLSDIGRMALSLPAACMSQ